MPVVHNPGTVLLGIVATAVAFQGALLFWKRRHQRSYTLTSLLLLWTVPFIISLRNLFWRFLLVWCAYSAYNGYLLKMISASKLDPATPSFVYKFYRGLFKTTMGIAGLGYGLFLLNVFAFPSALIIDLSLNLLFYGLYFGVLSRDLIEYASETMASTVGYYSKNGFPSKHLRENTCAVCGNQVLNSSSGQEGMDSGLLIPESQSERVVLNCGHTFHSLCLHGWCLIGKKDICPYCLERVDLGLFIANPWKDPEFVYGKMLDIVRYLVVWNPLLFLLLHFVIEMIQR